MDNITQRPIGQPVWSAVIDGVCACDCGLTFRIAWLKAIFDFIFDKLECVKMSNYLKNLISNGNIFQQFASIFLSIPFFPSADLNKWFFGAYKIEKSSVYERGEVEDEREREMSKNAWSNRNMQKWHRSPFLEWLEGELKWHINNNNHTYTHIHIYTYIYILSIWKVGGWERWCAWRKWSWKYSR